MRILINGAGGHMGRILRGLVESGARGASLAGAVESFSPCPGTLPSLDAFAGEADCLIDFSHHASALTLTAYAARHHLPLVIAPTGQTAEELALIREAAREIPVFLSANLSLGIPLLAQLVQMAARAFPEADIEIVEQHHNRKVDVPSGTALLLGDAIREVRPQAELLVGRHENGRRTPNEIGVHSLRLGNVVGIHEVLLSTGTQTITLRHEAHDRALFAEGALSAAAFLIRMRPGLYSMNDLIRQLGKESET